MMDSTIKAQWLSRLNNPDYIQATGYLKVVGGAFDALGLLCDIYLQANYILVVGQSIVAGESITSIQSTRQILVDFMAEIGSQNFGRNIQLDNAVRDLYYSDVLTPADKDIIKSSWSAIVVEQVSIDSLAASLIATYREIADNPGTPPEDAMTADHHFLTLTVAKGDYDTAVTVYKQWLATLNQPGGWNATTQSFNLDYTSVDTSARWENVGEDFFFINGYKDKLPEAVQRWAKLRSNDPVLMVGDAYGFHGATLPMFLNKLNDGFIQKNDGGNRRNYTVAELVEFISQQL